MWECRGDGCDPRTVSCSTFLFLDAIITSRSKSTLSMVMPCLEKSWLASWKRWLEWRRALDGMHPTLRHVPPRVPRLSTHAVFRPSCEALMAATYPPGPPPTTTRSYSDPAAAAARVRCVVATAGRLRKKRRDEREGWWCERAAAALR